MLESITPQSDDENGDGETVQTRSGVFRRIMARDLYDVTKRVEELEQSTRGPLSSFLMSWRQIALILTLVILFAGSMLYFDYRVDRVELLQGQEALELRSKLDSQKFVLEEIQQTVRAQSRSLRTMNATLTVAAAVPGSASITAENANVAPENTQSREPRTKLPAILLPGEVLVIVASTLTEEEAVDHALALEDDGHASEVILGMSGYYGVALGRFDFEQAKSLKMSIIESGAANTPYLMNDETIDTYVYP